MALRAGGMELDLRESTTGRWSEIELRLRKVGYCQLVRPLFSGSGAHSLRRMVMAELSSVYSSFVTKFTVGVLLFTSCSLPSDAQAQGVQNDFDGDGISDLTLVDIDSSNLRWFALQSGASVLTEIVTFGKEGDHLMIGQWITPGEPQAATVRKPEQGEEAVWRLDMPGSNVRTRSFGGVENTFVGGGDFNGNGVADGAVLGTQDGKIRWQIWSEMFADTPGEKQTILFGNQKQTQRAFYVNPDASHDWLAIAKYLPKLRRVRITLRNPQGDGTMQLSLPFTGEPARPVPLRGADGRDYILLYKKLPNAYRLSVYSLSGQRLRKGRVQGKGDLVVGNFTTDPGEEVVVQKGAGFTIWSPQTGARTTLNLQNSIPVDEVNLNSFSVSGEDVSLDNCNGADPTDGSGGFVWKPNSDTQYYAVAVLPSNLNGAVTSVETYSSSGERIKDLNYKGCGNDDGTGPRCAYQDPSTTGADYHNQYGSIILKVNLSAGGCLSYFLQNPAVRID